MEFSLQNITLTTSLKGECEALGDNMYSIGDTRQADKYTKTTEVILNYIQANYTEGNDVKEALENLNDYDFDQIKPVIPAGGTKTGTVDDMILREEVKSWCIRKKKYEDNMHKAYALILGQCTEGLKNKLQSRKDWDNIKNKPIETLNAIKQITHNYQDSRYPIA